MSAPDVCVAGPAQPTPPMIDAMTERSISWSWAAPEGHGLPVASYVFQYDVTNGNGTFSLEQTTLSTDIMLSQLPPVPTDVYLARVKACSDAGCSPYSGFASPASVLPPAAATQLAEVAATINSDPVGVMASGLGNLTLTEVAVAAPEPEPQAPAAAEVLNITAEQMAGLLQGNASITLDGTPPPVQTPEPSGGVTFGAAAAGFSGGDLQASAGEALEIEVILTKFGDDSAIYGGSLTEVSLQWQTSGISAVPGVDYAEEGGSLTFSPGTVTQMLIVTMLASSSTSPKMLTIFLTNLNNAEPHPVRSRVNVTIVPANTTAAAIATTSATPVQTQTPTPTPTPSSVGERTNTSLVQTNISALDTSALDTSTMSPTTTPITAAVAQVVVSIVVGLPMSEAEFTSELRLQFRRGVAAAAGVSLDRIEITSIKAVSSSRRAAESLEVGVAVATANSTAAISVAEQLTDDQISDGLEANGIAGATVLQPPVLSTLPEACAAVESECSSAYTSCLTRRSACQCLLEFSTCLTGCHTPQLVTALSQNCSSSYCHSTCPLPPSAHTVEWLIDASVDNEVLLSSGEGVFIPRGALASNTKIGIKMLSYVPRVPGHQGLAVRSKALSFSPSGQTFEKEVTLRIRFNGSLPATGRRLAIFRHNTQTLDWNEKHGSETAATERMVEAQTNSFSTYAVFELDVDLPAPTPAPVRESSPAMGAWQIVGLVAIIILCMLILVLCISRQGKLEQDALARAKVARDTKELLEPSIIPEDPDLDVPRHTANVEVRDSAPSSDENGVERVAPIKISVPPSQVLHRDGIHQVLSDDVSPPETPIVGDNDDADEHQPRLDLFASALSSDNRQHVHVEQNRPAQTRAFVDENQPRLDLLAAQARGPSAAVASADGRGRRDAQPQVAQANSSVDSVSFLAEKERMHSS